MLTLKRTVESKSATCNKASLQSIERLKLPVLAHHVIPPAGQTSGYVSQPPEPGMFICFPVPSALEEGDGRVTGT